MPTRAAPTHPGGVVSQAGTVFALPHRSNRRGSSRLVTADIRIVREYGAFRLPQMCDVVRGQVIPGEYVSDRGQRGADGVTVSDAAQHDQVSAVGMERILGVWTEQDR